MSEAQTDSQKEIAPMAQKSVDFAQSFVII